MAKEELKREEEAAEEGSKPSAVKKRASGRRLKRGLLFVLGLLGVLLGLHVAGVLDARAVLFPVLARVPLLGPRISPYLPSEFRMTAQERRALELSRREAALNKKVEEMLDLERRLLAISQDLEERLAKASKDEEEALARLSKLMEEIAKLEGRLPPKLSDEEIKRLVPYFEGMRARSAAQVLSQMDETLAAKVLKLLPPDRASSILSRMEPPKAASLSRLITSN